MTQNDSLKNPVPLYNLLRKDIRDELDGMVFLAEDLYHKDVLIIRSGTFLDDEIIYRLLNFGIKRVKIILNDLETQKSPYANLSILNLKKQYLRAQKCIIADKDVNQINQLIPKLIATNLKESNIIAVNNSFPIKKLLEDKKPRYVFIDLNLYPNNGLKVLKEIKDYSYSQIFLTALVDQSKTELVQKLKKEVALYNATLLLKPVSLTQIKTLLINNVTNKDIKRYLAQKKYLKNNFKLA